MKYGQEVEGTCVKFIHIRLKYGEQKRCSRNDYILTSF
jgi:hypothetical protein